MMKARIHLDSQTVETHIGVFEDERRTKQNLLLSLVIDAEISKASESDDLGDTVDYLRIRNFCRDIASKNERHTLEAFAMDVVKGVFALDERIRALKVRVDKPDIFSEMRRVGVELKVKRKDVL